MKMTIDIDCTPAEARAFLGLPDVAAVQTAFAEELKKRMAEALSAMDAEKLFRTWFPAGLEGFGQLQKQFWAELAEAARKGSKG